LEDHAARFGQPDAQAVDLEGFIKDGRELRNQLVAVLHAEPNARAIDRRRVANWRGQAKALTNAYTMATWPPMPPS
jgi:hypothetical protein